MLREIMIKRCADKALSLSVVSSITSACRWICKISLSSAFAIFIINTYLEELFDPTGKRDERQHKRLKWVLQ
jgi:hypothetical protein